MKIAPKVADSFIAKPQAGFGAALIFGPDSGGVRDRAKKITTAILGANPDPFAIMEFTEAKLLADAAALSDELASFNMMVPKRVIIIRDGGDKLTKIIDAASPHFNDSAYLIVCAEELSTRSSLRGWFEKGDKVASLACYRDEVRDVQSVVRKAFEEAKLPVDREIIDYLSQMLGNDRYVTYQELDKIITYAGGQRLTVEDVRDLVDYNRETSLDDIVNAVADKDLKNLDKVLTIFLREGTQPIVYLRALQRYFNRLYAMKAQVAAGQTIDSVVAGVRPPVFFRQVPILTRHLQNWGLEQITRALSLLISAELACKTSDIPHIPVSSRLLMQVAQIR